MTIQAGIIGWPIEHSKSPLIHTYWLQKYGVDGHYDRTAIAPDALAGWIKQAWDEGLAGFNTTIPHKESLMTLVMPDEMAKTIGAINTVYRTAEGWRGTNTDGVGWWRSLNLASKPKTALIIGAGGAAKAIAHTLASKDILITITNRTRTRAQAMGHGVIDWPGNRFDGRGYDLIVNTSACGMNGENPLTLTHLDPGTIVSDLVYTPLETQFLKSAGELGGFAVDGLGMLLHQAAGGFELWFGVRPEVTDELRQAVLAR